MVSVTPPAYGRHPLAVGGMSRKPYFIISIDDSN